MPNRLQIYVETIDGGDKVFYSTDDIPVFPNSDGRQLISISSLKAYRKYNAIVAAKNVLGDSNSTGEIPFSKSVYKLHTGCTFNC